MSQKKLRKPFTKEHKKKLSDSHKRLWASGWVSPCKGRKVLDRKDGKELLLKNMRGHLRFSVSLEWLLQFDDIEKLKFLNKAIVNREGRWEVSTKWYKNYILRFYQDDQFNKIYSSWLLKGKKDMYMRPTLDHIHPRSKGGDNSLENLMFLTWFENRAKNNMSLEEWQKIKENIEEYFI